MNQQKPSRQFFEIVAEVLESCPTWAKQTKVILAGSSRWTVSRKICCDLEQRGLLESKISQRTIRGRTRHALSKTPENRSFILYRRTAKGSQFVHSWRSLVSIWNDGHEEGTK
jgi:predicted transcriptional regulator